VSRGYPEDKGRYREKCAGLGLCDPYLLPRGAMTPIANSMNLPDVTFAEIFLYLINFPSSYTVESMRAYKALDAYRFFVAGKVYDMMLWQKTSGDKSLFIVRSRVRRCAR
jgi:hypothetical protein